MKIIEITFIVGALVFLPGLLYVGPSYIRRLNVLISELKSRKPAKYKELGRPTMMIIGRSFPSSWNMTKFVLFADYRELADATVSRYGDAVRWRLIVMILGSAFIILMPFVIGVNQ